ncbi:hypothetical protein L0657_21550 [Dyadobacter sp. CY345]|uniref:hypothetical protein n=1 Tax=Dyadobacter sp. CY345 TaxID=2909335 RepID=UPI001F40B440|nr:hypothetical protein [Dyadobacter sp. CY345]MCF2446557.1 hypothetical protein [Dyadobacter sp. CY345]
METTSWPTNLSAVLFTDKNGITREGIYKRDLNAFVEALGDEGPEDPGNLYPEDNIRTWEYLDEKKSPDSDFMVIL